MRHAFTMLELNQKDQMLEQLMTDNENLIDQLQRMKEPIVEVSLMSDAKPTTCDISKSSKTH